jgi:hypothetical protein
MKPVFFVQNNYVERLTAPVAVFAREEGVCLEDRSSTKEFDPDQCGIDWSQYSIVLPYGSIQFVRALKGSSLERFVLHDEARFSASNWTSEFADAALNCAGRRVAVHQVAEILRRDGSQHLRPDRVDKAFHGGVFDALQWDQVRLGRELSEELECWVSPLQDIETEWRCWIVGGAVVEISKYRAGGKMAVERETSEAVRAAAQSLAERYLPASCVVLDMAYVSGRHQLIEFNPIHCSGWYGADVNVVLSAWLQWSLDHLPSRHTGDLPASSA